MELVYPMKQLEKNIKIKKCITMKNLFIIGMIALLAISCNQSPNKETEVKTELTFEQQLEDYFEKYNYQETYKYLLAYTAGGDPQYVNIITPGAEAVLVKAGNDKVVRTNNDTYYGGGVVHLSEGPVKLISSESDESRFYSFQLMDDRNVNFKNIIRPNGEYYLYYGDKPADLEGEAIESPSELVMVIVRVGVKDKTDLADVEVAQKVYNGITIEGPKITKIPVVDLLSSFDDKVVKRANEMIDSVFKFVPFYLLVPTPEQVPDEISYLYLAAGSKHAWGAPVASHSTYQMIHHDANNKILRGENGAYTLTSEEPNVDAFWSVTVYDTERGGFLHPNKEDRYHINNTSVVRNDDGTVTFLFKTQCEEGDINCLEVPAGDFDLAVRYYLPTEQLQKGQWKMPNPVLTVD
jgi:hypothetical protein